MLQEDDSIAVRLQHHKTEASAGPREWTILVRAQQRQPLPYASNTHCPAQADTLAAKAWACLVTQAAPLLRAGKETSLLFLSVQGEPLVGHNTLCNIATAQLAAAGLPGQTARSVGLPGWLAMGRSPGSRAPAAGAPCLHRGSQGERPGRGGRGWARSDHGCGPPRHWSEEPGRADSGLLQPGNSVRAWATSYDARRRDRAAEHGQAAYAAMVSPPASSGAAWGGCEEGEGALQLAVVPAKRLRNSRLDAILTEKAAKRAALEARKAAGVIKKATPVAVPKQQRGRPSGWTLRPDAPEFLSLEEFNALSTKELQLLWGDYYTGSATLESKSGNRAYLCRKLVLQGDESGTMTSADGGLAAALSE